MRPNRKEKSVKRKDIAEQIRVLQETQIHLTTDVIEISNKEERNIETLDITNVFPIIPWILFLSNSDSTSFCNIDHHKQISINYIDGISSTFMFL